LRGRARTEKLARVVKIDITTEEWGRRIQSNFKEKTHTTTRQEKIVTSDMVQSSPFQEGYCLPIPSRLGSVAARKKEKRVMEETRGAKGSLLKRRSCDLCKLKRKNNFFRRG